MDLVQPFEEIKEVQKQKEAKKAEEWTFRNENGAGPMFEAWSPSQKQEISCYRFDNSENHPPSVRDKFCLFVESNDNRAQIWLSKETLQQIIAGLQLVSE